MSYVTFTDGSANLNRKLARGVEILPCDYSVDDEPRIYDGDLDRFDYKTYYEKLKNGSTIRTSLMEYLDIVDEKGNPTGQIVERKKAHAEGIRHRTSHVWIVRKKTEQIEILLQRRCDTKESFPGCYDISSAGHIPAGVDYKASAVRELKEELGIDVVEDELIYCGDRDV